MPFLSTNPTLAYMNMTNVLHSGTGTPNPFNRYDHILTIAITNLLETVQAPSYWWTLLCMSKFVIQIYIPGKALFWKTSYRSNYWIHCSCTNSTETIWDTIPTYYLLLLSWTASINCLWASCGSQLCSAFIWERSTWLLLEQWSKREGPPFNLMFPALLTCSMLEGNKFCAIVCRTVF